MLGTSTSRVQVGRQKRLTKTSGWLPVFQEESFICSGTIWEFVSFKGFEDWPTLWPYSGEWGRLCYLSNLVRRSKIDKASPICVRHTRRTPVPRCTCRRLMGHCQLPNIGFEIAQLWFLWVWKATCADQGPPINVILKSPTNIKKAVHHNGWRTSQSMDLTLGVAMGELLFFFFPILCMKDKINGNIETTDQTRIRVNIHINQLFHVVSMFPPFCIYVTRLHQH